MRCNERLFLLNFKGYRDEAHLSALGYAAQAHARVSRSHEDSRWTRGHPRAPLEGSQAARRLRIQVSGGSLRDAKALSARALGRALLASRPAYRSASFAVHGLAVAQPDPNFAHTLIVSVPKRVLVRAVDRNMLKRIAREQWRAASRVSPRGPVLLRLKREPPGFREHGDRARKAAWRQELASLFSRISPKP